MFIKAIESAGADLDGRDFTLVVSNLDLSSELRAYTEAGARLIHEVASVVENAEKAVREAPSRALIADALAKHAVAFKKKGATFHLMEQAHRLHQIAEIDDAAIRAWAAQRHLGEERTFLSSTVVYSQVLRVGRVQENKDPAARIRIGTRHFDVRLDSDQERVCIAAMQENIEVKASLTMRKVFMADGGTMIVPNTVFATRVETFKPKAISNALREIVSVVDMERLGESDFDRGE